MFIFKGLFTCRNPSNSFIHLLLLLLADHPQTVIVVRAVLGKLKHVVPVLSGTPSPVSWSRTFFHRFFGFLSVRGNYLFLDLLGLVEP